MVRNGSCYKCINCGATSGCANGRGSSERRSRIGGQTRNQAYRSELERMTATVLIHWSIRNGAEEEFLSDRSAVSRTTSGFLKETLYRVAAIDGEPDGHVNYVNVWHWASCNDFYAYFDIHEGAVPALKRYESAARREWLDAVEVNKQGTGTFA